MKTSASSLHFFQNIGRPSSPDVRFRIIVVGVDVPLDSTGNIAHALKDTSPNRRDASRTGLVFENTGKSSLGVAVPPAPHLHNILAQTICNLPVLEAVGCKKHYGRPLLGANRGGPPPV